MPALIEVKYFNTFVLKKVMQTLAYGSTPCEGGGTCVNFGETPVWNGSKGIPNAKGGYPRDAATNDKEWAIEEARINGGYNNTSVSFGAKAYLVEEEPNSSIRGNALIYSGIYNARTGVNNTNVFSVGTPIVKSVDPANGSIQKLYAEDTNLNIFQELKISRALIDKDAIYSAEGGGAVTSSNLVIGAIQPYAGRYGISKDPRSFAVYGPNKYFTDKNNNVVLRLSGGSIQEISNAGMINYFRSRFASIDTSSAEGPIIGGWDIYNKQYVVSTQQAGSNKSSFDTGYETISFDDLVQGWTSFFTYKPESMFSLANKFYSLKFGNLYEHYSYSGTRGLFYPGIGGVAKPTSITFIFNPEPQVSKTFKTIEYEGSNGWQVNQISSGNTGSDALGSLWTTTFDISSTTANGPLAAIYSYTQGQYSLNPTAVYPNAVAPYYYAGFNRKENKYVANIPNTSPAAAGEIIFGNQISGIKGYFTTVTIATDNVTQPGGEKELFAVGTNYIVNNGY